MDQAEQPAEQQEELSKAREEADTAGRTAKRLEQQRLVLQAQLQTLQAEGEEAREREDERNLQLLNATNAKAAAERRVAELEAAAAATTQQRLEAARAGKLAATKEVKTGARFASEYQRMRASIASTRDDESALAAAERSCVASASIKAALVS